MKFNNKSLGKLMLIAFTTVTSALAQDGPAGGDDGRGPNRPGGSPRFTPYVLKGVYTLSGKLEKSAAQNYASTATETSAIYVKSGGTLTAADPVISSSGSTTSDDNSSFFGLNAAVLATQGSNIKITGGSISTTGTGANGIFATGSGSRISLTKTSINATGNGAHGVMATLAGAVALADVEITTRGEHAAAVATDRGGGTINVSGGTFTTSGDKSPAIYSTGIIKVNHATLTAKSAEAAVVEGQNSIIITDSTLTAGRSRGVMIYQSFSGDARGTGGTFAMKGGSLTASAGPLFYVTNTLATIIISGVKLNMSSGTLIDAAVGEWGRKPTNGGTVNFTAEHEDLQGNLLADASSAINAHLESQTRLTGAVTGASLTLDSTSTWTVTADSTITGLNDPTGISINSITNIIGDGHDVHYDPTLRGNLSLGGRTYNLASGGHLLPTRSTNRSIGSDNSTNQNTFGMRGPIGRR